MWVKIQFEIGRKIKIRKPFNSRFSCVKCIILNEPLNFCLPYKVVLACAHIFSRNVSKVASQGESDSDI
jgi:hypothetical protein